MDHDIHATADAAVRVTRAASLFDRLADHLVAQIRDGLERGADGAEPFVELQALREQLDAFFPEFRQAYGRLLVKHLGPERAPQVIAALEDERVQLYFRALQAMEGELQGALQQLLARMAFAAQSSAHTRAA